MKSWQEFIITDENILGGKPSIKGTRLSVGLILGRLSNGWSHEQLFESYPSLTKESLQAVYAFLDDCMNGYEVFITPNSLEKAS